MICHKIPAHPPLVRILNTKYSISEGQILIAENWCASSASKLGAFGVVAVPSAEPETTVLPANNLTIGKASVAPVLIMKCIKEDFPK